jgi:hypothetical protein
MANTTKTKSQVDGNQALQKAYNDVDATLGVNGFVVGKVGHKIELAISTTNVANDTETYTFSDNGTTLYVITVIYTDGGRDTLLSVERTA